MNSIRLREDLEGFEGKRAHPYDDRTGMRVKAPRGHISIGIGHNLDEALAPQLITAIYDYDVAVARRDAGAFLPPGAFVALSDVRQEVLVQMAFQLGLPVLRGFVRFRQAIIAGDHEKAADSMLDSKWAISDSPARAAKLAARWRSGEHEGKS